MQDAESARAAEHQDATGPQQESVVVAETSWFPVLFFISTALGALVLLAGCSLLVGWAKDGTPRLVLEGMGLVGTLFTSILGTVACAGMLLGLDGACLSLMTNGRVTTWDFCLEQRRRLRTPELCGTSTTAAASSS